MEDNKILSVEKLKVKFDDHVILDDISFDVKRGDILAVIGPNGAGKTVMFKAILGLIAYIGKIKWAEGVKIGYVPQRLFIGKDIPLTVEEFLEFKESDMGKVINVLEEVGLGEKGSHEVHRGKRLLKTRLGALSGGELQRILIVFALLGEAKVLLLDEPTSGVDISGEETIYTLITKLQKEKDLTIIFISHEPGIVSKYANKVFSLNREKIYFGPKEKVIDKKD